MKQTAYQLIVFPDETKMGYSDRLYKTIKGARRRAFSLLQNNPFDLVVIREEETFTDCGVEISGVKEEYRRENGMKTIYVKNEDVNEVLAQITKQQMRANVFVNVAKKEYIGKKHDGISRLVIG